jgi:hypothetical protein
VTRFLVLVGLLAGTITGAAQGGRAFDLFGRSDSSMSNTPYDGRFTFARIKYTTGPGGYYYHGLPAWAHGYTSAEGGGRAEQNLMKIMREVTLLNPHIEDTAVVGFDDPALFRYPVAYMTEPGFWTLSDVEAAGLRAYLQKGGFLIFDDFRRDGQYNTGGGWGQFEGNIHKALPEARIVDLAPSMQVFHTFFEIPSFDIIPQAYDRGRPVLRGIFENNDPGKRLMVVVNYSTDVAQYWEFSATGFRPIDESNEAYKLGVNYVMYGLTH